MRIFEIKRSKNKKEKITKIIDDFISSQKRTSEMLEVILSRKGKKYEFYISFSFSYNKSYGYMCVNKFFKVCEGSVENSFHNVSEHKQNYFNWRIKGEDKSLVKQRIIEYIYEEFINYACSMGEKLNKSSFPSYRLTLQ